MTRIEIETFLNAKRKFFFPKAKRVHQVEDMNYTIMHIQIVTSYMTE